MRFLNKFSMAYVIVLITFLVALIEKFSKKKPSERKGIWRTLNLENVSILLLGILLLSQLINEISSTKKERRLFENNNNTLLSIKSANDKLTDVNDAVETFICDVEGQIEKTSEELQKLDSLSNDIEIIRSATERSLLEFKQLNQSYVRKLADERKKIRGEVPVVKIEYPRSKLSNDSMEFKIWFEIKNLGVRRADTIRYAAIFIPRDSLRRLILNDGWFKSNLTEHNNLSLAGRKDKAYVITMPTMINKGYLRYMDGFLVTKISYFDWYDSEWIKSGISIYGLRSFYDSNQQLGLNVTKAESERVINRLSGSKFKGYFFSDL